MMPNEIFEEAVVAAIIFGAADRQHPPLLTQPDAFERTRVPAAAAIPPDPQFQPLDPDIVSESIPAFFIGRNEAGFWVAREAEGRIGGLFLFKSSAVEFAKAASEPSRCALVFPTGRFELDIENRGNPLAARLAHAIVRARRGLAPLAARWRRSSSLRP